MIGAYTCGAIAVVCLGCAACDVPFPLADGGRPYRRAIAVAQGPPQPPTLPAPPVNVVLVPEQDGIYLRLGLLNRGDAAEFRAEAVGILDDYRHPIGP